MATYGGARAVQACGKQNVSERQNFLADKKVLFRGKEDGRLRSWAAPRPQTLWKEELPACGWTCVVDAADHALVFGLVACLKACPLPPMEIYIGLDNCPVRHGILKGSFVRVSVMRHHPRFRFVLDEWAVPYPPIVQYEIAPGGVIWPSDGAF